MKRRRAALEWVGASFVAAALAGLFVVCTALSSSVLEGANVVTMTFMLLGLSAGFNTMFSVAYLVHNGMQKGDRTRRRRSRRVRRAMAALKEMYLEVKRLRRESGRPRRMLWLEALHARMEPRLKYPWRFYFPWGGGQHARYIASLVLLLATNLAEFSGNLLLVEQGLPISIGTFLAQASNCWLAIGGAFLLWPHFRLARLKALGAAAAGKLFAAPHDRAGRPDAGVARQFRRLFVEPAWGRLALAGIGLFSLAGVAVAAGLLSDSGVDVALFVNPVVLLLLVNSLLLAGVTVFIKRTRLREEKVFLETLGHLTPEDHLFLSTKQGLWFSVAFCMLGWTGFVVSGSLSGFPHVTHWGGFMGLVGIFLVVSLGNRIGTVAHGEGIPAFNGIGATGALGFSFFWSWLIQDIVVEPLQLFGAAMVFVGAIALVFANRKDRDQVMEILRRRHGDPR